ncbi:winged helix-turn-helix transcriptional regulator [Streptomyces sp. NRRL F-4489]|uniref:winged helix-turn-helix transcriptional regulator n=1 Tax=Streptomyces sp. NRRL F-4489 TaxID=1609095 RepID=UPI003B63D27F
MAEVERLDHPGSGRGIGQTLGGRGPAPGLRLEFNGLLERQARTGAPPRVDYELTALGRTLLPHIEAFGAWAFAHGDAVMAAQERGDGRSATGW